MRNRLRDESGFALIAVLLILIILMGIGVALVSMSDTQQNLSGSERVKESSVNLAEAALNAEALQLGRSWPTAATNSCDPTTSTASYCAQASAIANGYTTNDYASSCPGSPTTPLWKTQVNDNIIGEQYWTTAVSSRATYDANGDGTVWLRSWATVQCKPTSEVALVSFTSLPMTVPNTVLSANSLTTTNQGRKVIIDTLGTSRNLSQAQAAKIVLRCNGSVTNCANYNSSKGQIQPPTVQTNTGTATSALTSAQLQALEQQAGSATCPGNTNTANNHSCLWPAGSCPTGSSADLSSPAPGVPVVVVGQCFVSVSSNTQINSSASPGALVIENGTFTIGGTANFYGLLYMVNKQLTTGNVVFINGNATVQGSVLIDGNGGLSAGSSKTNLVYDQRATTLLRGSSGATVNRGSVRFLPPSTP